MRTRLSPFDRLCLVVTVAAPLAGGAFYVWNTTRIERQHARRAAFVPPPAPPRDAPPVVTPRAPRPEPAKRRPAVVVAEPDPYFPPPGPEYEYVRPYTRADGTRVSGYWRRHPRH